MKKRDRVFNILMKLIMFISSYCPLYLMLITLYSRKIISGFAEKNMAWIMFFIVLLIFIFISFGSIILLKLGTGKRKKNISTLKSSDDTVISYIMTYIIPLIAYQDSLAEVYIVNILFFILIGCIYLRLNLIYLNPLWTMFGYIVYYDENKDIIITNLSRESLKNRYVLYGYYLSNNIFVAHKKDNPK